MFDLNESQRYVHEYEELLKKPGYTPTPAMKQRYEEEKAAVGSSTQSTANESDSPDAQSTGWGNIWPGGIVWAMPETGPADWVDDMAGWNYIRSPNPETGKMEPIIEDPLVPPGQIYIFKNNDIVKITADGAEYPIYQRWETPKEEFIYKIDRSTVWAAEAEKITWKKEARSEKALAKLSQWWENFKAGNCD